MVNINSYMFRLWIAIIQET